MVTDVKTKERVKINTKNIGSRGVIFTLGDANDDLGEIAIYLIKGENRVYLCDTHLGPKSMEVVKEYLRENNLGEKQLVVFLTHSDWDHIWGACAFPDALIIGHDLCRKGILDRGKVELQRYADHQSGEIVLIPPQLTFSEQLRFLDDEVEFYYAPGHTADSAVCYDRKDAVLFVGDLVEDPKPMIGYHDLETYIDTLESLAAHPAKTIISSHSGIVNRKTISENIKYIRMFASKATADLPDKEKNDPASKLYIMLLYEDAIQQTLGDAFDYQSFQRELWGSLDLNYLDTTSKRLKSISYDELKSALESYLVQY